MEMVEAVALFDYNGRTNKELSFKTNQIIYIYKKINPQWWLGHIAGKNQSGFIPDGYIKLKSKFVLQFLLFTFTRIFSF
jgi:SLIT-ROBO Rho GTPase activating protein